MRPFSETLSHEFGVAQQKETRAINISLSMLKSVITALARREPFVPYRNSCLTKLLRNSLGGNAKTCVVLTISPMPVHARISRATLAFGQMAQTIINRAQRNEINEHADGDEDNSNQSAAAAAAALQIKELRDKIEGLEARLADYARLEADRARLQSDNAALQAHVSSLQRQRREDEQRLLQQRAKVEAASRVMEGAAEVVTAAKDAAETEAQTKLYDAQNNAALAAQVASLQTQKDPEETKRTLEAKLVQQQQDWQRLMAHAVRQAQRGLEASNAHSREKDKARIRALEQQLASRAAEDEARQAQVTQLQAALVDAQQRLSMVQH
jgi:chromosome segregation ATPase